MSAATRMTRQSVRTFADFAENGRVVAFDTETTGCACTDEICQIAAAEYVCGRLERTMSAYVRPSCEMSPDAERVHGLSMDFLAVHGIEPVEALRRFFDFLGSDVLLVAHNNRFDLRMLRQECEKFNVVAGLDGVELCDTLALSRHLRPDLESHALRNLLEPLGVDGVNSHDALDDAKACAGVFFRLVSG